MTHGRRWPDMSAVKETGLGDRLYVAGYDLSGDIGSVQRVSGGPAAMEVTGIDKSGYERIGGRRDGGIDFTSWFNDAAGQAYPVLSALPTADRIVSYYRGAAVGGPVASCVAKQVNYDGTRAADGAFTFTTNAASNGYGLEWGLQLTAGKKTDVVATNGTSIDYGAVS